MLEQDHYIIESIFTLGPLSDDLIEFTSSLFSHWLANNLTKLRKPETLLKMDKYSNEIGGSKEMGKDIISVMGLEMIAFVENLFPYDGIMPINSNLVHTCLFSQTGPVDDAEIQRKVQAKFGIKPALVFVNELKHKSVKDIWHAHIIVDRK